MTIQSAKEYLKQKSEQDYLPPFIEPEKLHENLQAQKFRKKIDKEQEEQEEQKKRDLENIMKLYGARFKNEVLYFDKNPAIKYVCNICATPCFTTHHIEIYDADKLTKSCKDYAKQAKWQMVNLNPSHLALYYCIKHNSPEHFFEVLEQSHEYIEERGSFESFEVYLKSI
ncbi:MAG: hypothetical protein ACTSWY_02180 [Promethearchaeota archaeon]